MKEERTRLGLSQDKLAQLADVARETWSRYEAGRLKPGAEVLTALARSGADVAYVLTGTRSPSAPASSAGLNREEEVLLDNYRHSSQEGRRALEATSAALAQPAQLKPTG